MSCWGRAVGCEYTVCREEENEGLDPQAVGKARTRSATKSLKMQYAVSRLSRIQ